jgi:hypothetical protein
MATNERLVDDVSRQLGQWLLLPSVSLPGDECDVSVASLQVTETGCGEKMDKKKTWREGLRGKNRC